MDNTVNNLETLVEETNRANVALERNNDHLRNEIIQMETAVVDQDETLLAQAETAETVKRIALDRATAHGYTVQGTEYIRTGEDLISRVLHAGAYDALYQDNLDILQDLLNEVRGKVDAANRIERAIMILGGAVRREKSTGVWFFDEEKGIFAISKNGMISYRDRYRDSLERVRDNFQLRFFERSLKNLNGLIKDEKPPLTRRRIEQHIAQVQKAQYSDADRGYIVAYLQAFAKFESDWEQMRAEHEPVSLPDSTTGLTGKPRQSQTKTRRR